MGEDMKTGPKVFLIISTLVFGFAFGIGAVVIGSRYENDAGSLNGCGLTSLPPLPTWLIVYGSTQIVFAIILTGALLIFNSAKQVFVVVSALCGCFNLAWNIVGAVALFRDSACAAYLVYPMWAMTLACLIITWINMLLSCVLGYSV